MDAGRAMSMGSMGGARRQTKAEQLADKLKLNKEQKEQFETILNAGREKANPLRQQIDNARIQIAGAYIEKKSPEEVKKAVDAYAAIQAQMVAVETEAFGKIYAMLKPNQQGKAAQGFELMAGIFDAQAGGRGGGMGRGQGQGRQQ